MIVYLNGQFLPINEARISPLDRGFLFGDGVYEVIPVYNGIPFLLEEHLQRLDRSLKTVDIKNTLSHVEWAEIIKQLSPHAATPTHGIYLQITRGANATRQHQYTEEMTPTLFAMTINIRLLSPEDRQQGLSAITATDQRWENCYIKSLNLLPNILATQQAYLQNACETILIKNGYVTEGSSSNVFIVKNGMIITSPLIPNILWGITRAFVLNLAKEFNIPHSEDFISEELLHQADEIWITSSGREVVPITHLNGHKVNDGKVGPVWKKIDKHFQTRRK